MTWKVLYSDEFTNWLDNQVEELQDQTLENLELLVEFGPTLNRPKSDTLKGSKVKNLKELRFEFKGAPIRVLYAFDEMRQALIILAGDKSAKRWYDTNIPAAERIFAAHNEKITKEQKSSGQQDLRENKKAKGTKGKKK